MSDSYMENADIFFQDTTFRFGNRVIIDSFSHRIMSGEHIAIVGESGAGKSTLLNSIVGLAIPTSGAIEVNGMLVNPTNICFAMGQVPKKQHAHSYDKLSKMPLLLQLHQCQ